MAPPVYSQTLILSGEPSSDSSSFPVKRAGETLIRFSVFFPCCCHFSMKSLRPQKVFRISCCCCCFIQLRYTCKCVKCIDILPGFTNKKQPKVPPGNTAQEISFLAKYRFDFYWATYFFPIFFFFCRISPVTGQHFSTTSAATPEKLFHRRRAKRRVKLEKLIASERSDL